MAGETRFERASKKFGVSDFFQLNYSPIKMAALAGIKPASFQLQFSI
jgi:hypothetical protein